MIKNYSLLKIVSVLLSLISVNLNAQSPCFTTPGTNTIVLSSLTVCPGALGSMSLANSYSVSGIGYQWQSSTISPVGPFSAIPGATLNTYGTPTMTMGTYYAVVITCTNVNATYVTSSILLNVAPGTTTNSVPYFEDFEGITSNNQLPNCSWSASNVGNTCLTYTNGTPYNGTKAAAFFNTPSGANYFYSNGLQLNAGVVYSVSLAYKTDISLGTNWSDLSILVGPNQSTLGAVTVTSTNGPAASANWKVLSGTFTVPSNGLNYIDVRGTGLSSGSSPYLYWDYLTVTIPCTGAGLANKPTLTLTPSSGTVCSGANGFVYTVVGANTYTWSDGSHGSTSTLTSLNAGASYYVVIGTNTLTGCTATATATLVVNASPITLIYANTGSICEGQTVTLNGLGANSYSWSIGSTGSSINVSPSVTTTYSLVGTNSNGCSSSASQVITVLPSPVISVAGNPVQICSGDSVVLTGTGASNSVTLQWSGFSVGANITVSPISTSNYTLLGISVNGCISKQSLSLLVNACVGLEKNSENNFENIYPNPFNEELNLKYCRMGTVVELRDLNGKVLIKKVIDADNVIIDTKQIPSGVYFMKLQSTDGNKLIKVIKH